MLANRMDADMAIIIHRSLIISSVNTTPSMIRRGCLFLWNRMGPDGSHGRNNMRRDTSYEPVLSSSDDGLHRSNPKSLS